MAAAGIICEYNPFHKGHLYHIEQTRLLTGADDIICVMSGNYVQRGEPAILDKWLRTSMALEAGASLVLELPTYYACASAEFFAFGAVSLLQHTGITDFLCFGCEEDRSHIFQAAAAVLYEEPAPYRSALKTYLSQGFGFAAARARALHHCLSQQYPNVNWQSLIEHPNNILAMEYYKALLRLHSPIQPVPVQRMSGGYSDPDLNHSMPSASAIRLGLARNEDILSCLPPMTAITLQDAISQGLGPVFFSDWSADFYYALSQHTPKTLHSIADMAEGLENRLFRQAKTIWNLDELVAAISCKRYPYARIRRILLNILLNISQERRQQLSFAEGPAYLRILGFRKEREGLLHRLSQSASLPVITNLARQFSSLDEPARSMLEDEIRFTDLYMGHMPNKAKVRRGLDLTQPLLIWRS
ncbi:nucleotidyltransferase [Bianquea renquensis]|uniref:tRNA(Met) cytidine acetate ligase n=1 Tax=Bianquea renquensis TaxID=2763661 RepID=A0A926DRA9_9FIRM|nr:nucleotidyltransferase [Bianquea renquensis]MBC8543773.1 nucleotidyltransferase [Bianquea renquensis]